MNSEPVPVIKRMKSTLLYNTHIFRRIDFTSIHTLLIRRNFSTSQLYSSFALLNPLFVLFRDCFDNHGMLEIKVNMEER